VGYRSNRYYWEVIISFRKAAVVGTSVFLVQAGPRWQTLVAQAMTGVLLFMHVAYRPFVRINSEHNTLHNADMFAMLTAFITMSAGIYLFQISGDDNGFQIFLQIVVIAVNVAYMAVAIWWWLTLKLIDLGNSMEHEDNKNHALLATSVLCLQKCLPDWREETVEEEIRQSEEAELKAMGRANLADLLKAKRVAQNWLLKARVGKINREAVSVEKDFEENQKKKSKVLKSRQKEAHKRLLRRQTARNMKEIKMAESNMDKGPNIASIAAREKLTASVAAPAVTAAAATNVSAEDSVKLSEGVTVVLNVPKKVNLKGLGFHLQPPKKSGKCSQYCWAADIDNDGLAAKAGVRHGDVLIMVNDQSAQLNSSKKVVNLLLAASRPMKLVFLRQSNVKRWREEHSQSSKSS
jgi:hypothetical protein